MLDIVQPENADVNEDETYDKVVPHERYATHPPIIPVSRELNGLIVELTDNKHYSAVPFRIHFFLVRVFLKKYQLKEIGNIFLSTMMVDMMILCSLLTVSISCSVHVAIKTQLESPKKTWLL
jgi:hypothetical protein